MNNNFYRGLLIAVFGIVLFFNRYTRSFSLIVASFGLGIMFADLFKNKEKKDGEN